MQPMQPMQSIQSIQLTPEQTSHVSSLIQCLGLRGVAIDTSSTGNGKTPCACQVAQELQVPFILIVAPPTAADNWRAHLKQMCPGILHNITTYDKIRGVSPSAVGTTVKHTDYLIRTDCGTRRTDGRIVTTTTFEVSADNRLLPRTLLILDEAHHIKNPGLQNKAVSILSQHVRASNGQILLLSATLRDKREHTDPILRAMGICTFYGPIASMQKIGFRKALHTNTPNFKALVDVCIGIDALKTIKIMDGEKKGEENQGDRQATSPDLLLLDDLFEQIIVPECAFGISRSRKDGIERLYDNRYFRFSNSEDYKTYQTHCDDLGNVVALAKRTGKQHFGAMQLCLMALHRDKVPLVAKDAKRVLTTQHQSKVIIALTFTESVEAFIDFFRTECKLECAVITGKTPVAHRTHIQQQFNAPNSDCRILLTTITESMSFHDVHGDFPRTMYIFPTFHMTSMMQACGRTDRHGVQSRITVIVPYGNHVRHGKEGVSEQRILKSILRKSTKLRILGDQQVQDGVCFLDENPHLFQMSDGSFVRESELNINVNAGLASASASESGSKNVKTHDKGNRMNEKKAIKTQKKIKKIETVLAAAKKATEQIMGHTGRAGRMGQKMLASFMAYLKRYQ